MKIAPFKIDAYIKNIEQEKVAGALVFGADAGVVSSRFSAIAKKITPDMQDQFLVVNLSKERINSQPSCLDDEFYSYSMFGGRKLIIIRDIDAAVNNALKELLKNDEAVKKSDNFILIQGGDLEKTNALRKTCENYDNFAAIACYEDSDELINKLIQQQLRKNAIEVSPDMVRHLFEILPKNRQIIAAEIDKIAIYLDGGELTLQKIDEIVATQSQTTFEQFLDSFISRNHKNSSKALDGLFLSGFDAIMATRFLANHLQKLYNARVMIDKKKVNFDEAVRDQHLFFKAEAAFKRHLKALTLKQINFWLAQIQELEVDLKTKSNISQKSLFFMFLNQQL